MKRRTRFWIIVAVIGAATIYLYTDYILDRMVCASLLSTEQGVENSFIVFRPEYRCLSRLDTPFPWSGYFPW